VLGRCSGTSVWINRLCRLETSGAPLPNSTGQGARIGWTGTAGVSDNNLTLRATHVPPGASGTFIVAQNELASCVPDGAGLRCIDANARQRILPATADANGNASASLDFGDPRFEGVRTGAERYIQFRYDDPAAVVAPRGSGPRRTTPLGAATYNWTDTLEMKVCP
jgi:hypothetical protein